MTTASRRLTTKCCATCSGIHSGRADRPCIGGLCGLKGKGRERRTARFSDCPVFTFGASTNARSTSGSQRVPSTSPLIDTSGVRDLQCKLAKQFEAALASKGIDGFPRAVRNWYKQSYGGSTVRLLGAVRFSKEGIDKIWFALFPRSGRGDIRDL